MGGGGAKIKSAMEIKASYCKAKNNLFQVYGNSKKNDCIFIIRVQIQTTSWVSNDKHVLLGICKPYANDS